MAGKRYRPGDRETRNRHGLDSSIGSNFKTKEQRCRNDTGKHQYDPEYGSRNMSKQRWIAAIFMVAISAAAMVAGGDAQRASAAPITSLDFDPPAIALEGVGDTEIVDIVVAGLLADEADTVQINIQHNADFEITLVGGVCGPLYASGFASAVIDVDGGSAFVCALQNGPTAAGGGVVASIEITRIAGTTGLSLLSLMETGPVKTAFFEAGNEVALPTPGDLSVWNFLDPVSDQSINEGAGPLIFDVNATLATTPTLTHSVTAGGPASFIQFTDNGDSTGTFTITPGFDDAGVYTVDVIADNTSAIGTETFTVTVNDMNRAPVLAAIGGQSVDENANLPLVLSSTDDDGDTLELTVTVDLTPIPSGVPTGFTTFIDNGDGSGTLDFDPGFADSGTYSVVVTVTDDSVAPNGILNDFEAFTLTVNDINQNPTIIPIADQSVDEGKTLDVFVTSSDPDGQIPTLSATVDGSPIPALFAAITPTGDGSTATLSFTPAFGDVGAYAIVVTANDGASGTFNESFTLTVDDVASVIAPAGTVKLQGLPDRGTSQAAHDAQLLAIAPVVDLIRVTGGGVEATVAVGVDGSFAFHDIPRTTNYQLRVRAAGYLPHLLGDVAPDEINVSVSDADLTGTPVMMLGGQITSGDTVVDSADLAALLGAMFFVTADLSGASGREDSFGNVVDINASGVIATDPVLGIGIDPADYPAVTAQDISMLISNYLLPSGDQPWK